MEHASAARRAPVGRVPVGRVLVGWDGSDGARDAVRLASALADGGLLVAVTVTEPAPYHAEPHEEPASPPGDLKTLAEDEIRAAMPVKDGCLLDYRVVAGGRIPEGLRDYAHEHGFDLVVVGRHGADGLRHFRLGHVPDGLARHSTLSVLIAGPAGN